MVGAAKFLTAGLALAAPVARAAGFYPQGTWAQRCERRQVGCEDCRRNIIDAQKIFTPGAGKYFIKDSCEALVACTCAWNGYKGGKCRTDSTAVEICKDLAKMRPFCAAQGITVGEAKFCT
ncbi:uncharacterized protein UV8b_03278 [Ustilaginoidea virens]|uniref:Uncharacterized protein n=1 Tax=Ustilaginoidea virens TaxID=1159556 RepID=A0A8E5MGL6_USTVR|nr:uncharacterized protein UV8b_03278 [Ustilaginoidea virens]QUC19037.1 hypothetical protein UV8b_03278 [Ustilaginoidea virens]